MREYPWKPFYRVGWYWVGRYSFKSVCKGLFAWKINSCNHINSKIWDGCNYLYVKLKPMGNNRKIIQSWQLSSYKLIVVSLWIVIQCPHMLLLVKMLVQSIVKPTQSVLVHCGFYNLDLLNFKVTNKGKDEC